MSTPIEPEVVQPVAEQTALAPAPPKPRLSTDEALAEATRALGGPIGSDEQAQAIGAILTQRINPAITEINKDHDDNINNWHRGHKDAIAKKAEKLNPWQMLKLAANNLILAWDAEKERRAADVRKQIEAKALLDAETALAEEYGRLIEAGEHEEAEEVLAKIEGRPSPRALRDAEAARQRTIAAAAQTGVTLDLPPVEVAPQKVEFQIPVGALSEAAAPTKIAGVSRRKTWKYRLLDASKLKREYMIPNEALITATVKNAGAAGIAMVGEPGCIEVYQDSGLGSGSR